MKISHILSAIALIFLSVSVVVPSANAAGEVVTVKHAKAKLVGKPNCESKYPAGSGQGTGFRHLLTKSCYSCPAGYKRTVFPINAKNACERVIKAKALWSKATYRGKALRSKPSGAFLDPRNGGEYWSCPKGTHRTVFPVTGSKACERRAKSVYKKTSKYRKNSRIGQGCPSGKFWDVKGGNGVLGACYSCPSGYKRSASAVDSSKACIRRIGAALYKATKVGSLTNPKPKGAFLDPRNKGEYWSCPAGYGRTVAYPVNHSKRACKKTVPGRSYAAKSKKRGTFGCKAGAFQNGLENACYTCPKGYSRSAVPGTNLHKMKSACVYVKVDPRQLRNAKFVAWAKKEAVNIKKRYDRDMKQVMSVLKKTNPAAMVKKLKNAKNDKQRMAAANALLSPLTKWIVKSGTRKKASLPMQRASILQPIFDGGDRITVADGSTSSGVIFRQIAINKPKVPNAKEMIEKAFGPAGDRAIRNALSFKTTSVGMVVDGSFVVGGVLTPLMLAVDNAEYARKGQKSRNRKFYNAAAATIGNSVGADGAVEIGLWRDQFDGLSGGSFGIVGAAALKGGLGLTLWWSTEEKPRFLGIVIGTQIGMSAEAEFTAGGTWLRDGR